MPSNKPRYLFDAAGVLCLVVCEDQTLYWPAGIAFFGTPVFLMGNCFLSALQCLNLQSRDFSLLVFGIALPHLILLRCHERRRRSLSRAVRAMV